MLSSGYVQPLAYAGPTVTVLSSSVNSTHWKAIYRCQNCTTWEGGSLNTASSQVTAWVIGLTAVTDPTDINTNFAEHDDCKIHYYDLRNGSLTHTSSC